MQCSLQNANRLCLLYQQVQPASVSHVTSTRVIGPQSYDPENQLNLMSQQDAFKEDHRAVSDFSECHAFLRRSFTFLLIWVDIESELRTSADGLQKLVSKISDQNMISMKCEIWLMRRFLKIVNRNGSHKFRFLSRMICLWSSKEIAFQLVDKVWHIEILHIE